MRIPLVLSTLALAVLPLLGAADDKKSDPIDKKVTDLTKQAGDLFKNAKSLHVEGSVVTDIDNNGEKKQVKSEAVYDMERPKSFALKTKVDGKADAGPDLFSDGTKLFVHSKNQKQYTESDAVDMPDVGMQVLRLGTPFTGILFQNVLAADPYEALMDGVNACSYVGKDKVDGTEAHHLKFEQDGLNWEMWVAAGDKPLVLKIVSTRDLGGAKMTTVETYKNWKFDAAPEKDSFKFTPGEKSKKVDEIDTPAQQQ